MHGSGLPGLVLKLGLRRLLIANVVAQIAIIVTGGVVRLTGSGLGCPTWPECVDGSIAPTVNQAESWHKYVEFGNRLLTFALAAVAALALVAVWRYVTLRLAAGTSSVTAGRKLRLLGAVPFLGIPAQAVIGGVSVLTDLNPWVVSLHFLCSAAMVAASTWLLLEVGPGEVGSAPMTRAVVRVELRWLALLLALVAAVVQVLGTVVTGSGPHSGDGDVSHRFGFDVRSVSWLHADAVWLFVGLVVALVVALRLVGTADLAVARRRAVVLLVVTLAQGLIGYVQYFTGVPAVLVALHMLGAGVLAVAVAAAVHPVLRRAANPPVALETAGQR